MARYTGPVCKLCRREGLKLFLKGSRCLNKDKCSFEDRKAPPGLPPKKKGKQSEYSLQLREKQKVKRIYGVLEKQFRDYFEKANNTDGITGEVLLQLLERRLDNVVYRMGFASSRAQSRSFISQGHILVNGVRVDISSYQTKIGDVVSIQEKFKKSSMIEQNVQFSQSLNRNPSWVTTDFPNLSGEITSLPLREHIDLPIKEQVIVELYSK
ncbi:MAG: 30S ribosomal protein S4 [Leptospiraceae bacterium]|nr:30S ribosomal protein S4 [Leptospiraceae bacterium]MCP5511886.1 30S ribosomal protein S4 [Leptospiraceae bacterium]